MLKEIERQVVLTYFDTNDGEYLTYRFTEKTRTKWGARRLVKKKIGYLGTKKDIRITVL